MSCGTFVGACDGVRHLSWNDPRGQPDYLFSFVVVITRPQASSPAIHVVADDVRMAGVLLEGGFDANPSIKTQALLLWYLGIGSCGRP